MTRDIKEDQADDAVEKQVVLRANQTEKDFLLCSK
jgi:hypothetical protein